MAKANCSIFSVGLILESLHTSFNPDAAKYVFPTVSIFYTSSEMHILSITLNN